MLSRPQLLIILGGEKIDYYFRPIFQEFLSAFEAGNKTRSLFELLSNHRNNNNETAIQCSPFSKKVLLFGRFPTLAHLSF
jgi:hypothetical protein